MSIIFMDGFDYVNNTGGAGGRKWAQGNSDNGTGPGRFGGQMMYTGGAGTGGVQANMTNAQGDVINCNTIILGYAMLVSGYNGGGFGGFQPPEYSCINFNDQGNCQCTLWIDPSTFFLSVRLGNGNQTIPTTILITEYTPPLGLWFYLEIKITFGNPGSVELRVDGDVIGSATGTTITNANSYCNNFQFCSFNSSSSGVQGGVWNYDDLYVINVDGVDDPTTGAWNDYLGEVRIQTQYPDANGYENDFFRNALPGTPGATVNAYNVNGAIMTFNENGIYNYSGTVGALDLYSIGNFTVSGTIFAVQENISFKKDDVGNRKVAPLLRTANINYLGEQVYNPANSQPGDTSIAKLCYSNYTYDGFLWQVNPETSLPWALIDLNLTEFGMLIVA